MTDRFDRRRTMIATDLVRAGLIAAVPFTPNLGAVYAIAFCLEGMSLVFLPARDSHRPEHRPEGEARRRERTDHAPPVGNDPDRRWARRRFGCGSTRPNARADHRHRSLRQRFALPFFFDALTFLVSAWAIYALPAAIGKVVRHLREKDESALHAIESDMVEGARYLLEDHGRRNMIFGMALRDRRRRRPIRDRHPVREDDATRVGLGLRRAHCFVGRRHGDRRIHHAANAQARI